MSSNSPIVLNADITYEDTPKWTTYGALILPYDIEEIKKETKVKNDPKTVNDFKGKLRSALNLNPDDNLIKGALKSPSQTFETLAEYMKDDRSQLSQLTTVVGSKFSGIAVAQALSTGKVTSKEALDYLFMGFAPALGVTGSLFGYSGLTQLKDALSNGSIDVGSFVSGFTRTLKGAVDLNDMLKRKENKTSPQILEFDLTISHNESYQSETPDRRVQSGQSLNEYVHNMPETFSVQCALQEGKRYSKAEFRAILVYLRNIKNTVSLILGDEIFDNLILTNFEPTNDCSKSGMDYTLSFKKVTRSDIDTETEVTLQEPPVMESEGKIGGLGSSSSSLGNISGVNIKDIYSESGAIDYINSKNSDDRINSTLETIRLSAQRNN